MYARRSAFGTGNVVVGCSATLGSSTSISGTPDLLTRPARLTVVKIAAGAASCRTNARRSSGVLMSIGK